MRISDNITTPYLIKAIRDIAQQSQLNLTKTFAKVVNVEKEGYFVEVEFVHKTQGASNIKNVPVLKNKYFNTPIYKGDLVILLTLDEILDSYTSDGSYQNALDVQNYFALPYTMLKDYQHKNEFSIQTQEKKFDLRLNEQDGLKINTELPVETQADSIKASYTKSAEVTVNQTFKLEAAQSIEVKTAALSLGKAFGQLIDALASVPTMTTQSGGAVNEWPAIVAQLKSIKTLIEQNFK